MRSLSPSDFNEVKCLQQMPLDMFGHFPLLENQAKYMIG